MLLLTMAMSTFSFFAVVVVASEIQDELGISKLQLGILGAVNTGIGGIFGLQAGKVCDRLGGRRAMALVLIISAATAAFMALSQTYVMLLIGMMVAGFAQGLGNPATNRAIATGIEESQRGLMTGLKQSGVQLAVFSAGFSMPAINDAFGWRAGLWMMTGISIVALAGLGVITELDRPSDDRADDRTDEPEQRQRDATGDARRLPTFVYQVGVFGFLLGFIGGGHGRFMPLFAEEAVGFSAATAGMLFGLAGLIAIPSRVISGMSLDRGVSARTTLMVMAIGGAIAIVLMLLADPGPNGLMWAGTILSGLTLGSWNTAANLAMIRQGNDAGRATGVLIVGFMLGLTLGGPAVGWSIDNFDSYTPAWIASAVLSVIGAAVLVARRDA